MASGKVANSLGADIDSDRMDQRLHQLFDWQYGTKLSSSEVRKLEAKYNDVIDEVSVDNQLDLEDEEQLQQANNLASYKIFISKLKQEQAKARDEGSENGGALRAVLQIYQTKYLKEIETAASEGRPVQEFGNFIAEVNRSNVYRTSAFMAKVHGSVSSALAEVELALASESLVQMVRTSSHAGLDPASQIPRADQSASHSVPYSGHAGLDPASRGQLTPTSDLGSQETTDLLLYNVSVSFSRGPLSPADVEVISATGNILGLGQQTRVSFDSPFYRQSGPEVTSDYPSYLSVMPKHLYDVRNNNVGVSLFGVPTAHASSFGGEAIVSSGGFNLLDLGVIAGGYSLRQAVGFVATGAELAAVLSGAGVMLSATYADGQWRSQETTRLAAVNDCSQAPTASDYSRASVLIPDDDHGRDILARKFACEASTDFVDSLDAASTPASRAPSNTSRGVPFRPSDESEFGRFYMQQLQSNPSAAADPAHLGPQILSTPMPEDRGPQIFSTPLPEFVKPTILGTPDDRDRFAGLFDLPGYEPTDIGHDTLQESFPIHDHDWKDSVLLKDYEIDHWDVKPLSVGAAPEVYANGKFGKIYQDGVQKVGNKEIWYSKDTAKHSGASQGLSPSTYKLFVLKNKEFEWIADVDATGKVIEGKTKSETGRNIPVKQCWKVK